MADGREEHVWTYHAKEHTEIMKAHFDKTSPIWTWGEKVLKRDAVLVDYGCGSGLWRLMFPYQDYRGLDQNAAMIAAAKNRYPHDAHRFSVTEWNKLNLEDESVDAFFTSAVIQHNKHEEKDPILKEFVRVLKPGGHLLMTETTFTPENFKTVFPHLEWSEDLSDGYSFTKTGWTKFMKTYGLELIEFKKPGEYLFRKAF